MTLIAVRVKPNTKRQQIIEEPDGSLTVYLKSPPIEGKANRELITLLAEKYAVPKSQILIKSGLSTKHKLIQF